MSSSSSLLSEEWFQCSICLDVFTDPVSTPCGHNFCKACISRYWDSTTDMCQCPLCKKTFKKKPELCVNTFISEMASEVKHVSMSTKKELMKGTEEQPVTKAGEVPCDICLGKKFIALKSCLVCLASFCETHLEPHQRVASFQKHKLIDPVLNLEDRVCKKHEKPLERFCKRDQMCVCQFCTEIDHKTHETVSIEEEFGKKKAELTKTKTNAQQMIQDRKQKVKEIEKSVEFSKKDAEKEIADITEVLTSLVCSIERRKSELVEEIEKKQKAAEKRAEGLIDELEQEITEIERRCTELEQLSHTDDHLHLLQTLPLICPSLPTKDWSEISVHGSLCVGTVRRTVAVLEQKLNEEIKRLFEIELRRMQHCSVDVILDPDTAHHKLILSQDGKKFRLGEINQVCLNHRHRFDYSVSVLGKEGFSSGRFYYEVQVKGKTVWIIGVVRESINRKGSMTRSPETGHWSIGLWEGSDYRAHAGPDVHLSLRERPEKVGVFVDYEEGLVSFYNVDDKSHIYSFIDCNFTERLFPCFSTGNNVNGKNGAPLKICPVSKKKD